MLDDIRRLKSEAEAELAAATAADSEKLRVKYLGRNGLVTSLFPRLGEISPEERPLVGRELNELKKWLESSIKTLAPVKSIKAKEFLDVSLCGKNFECGARHPVRIALSKIVGAFEELGFSTFEGPEVETEHYNFEALNVPKHHPARDMQDTFYLNSGFLLRTHTSPVQIHVMEKNNPPICMIAPGAVYRRDSDVTHSPMFHQVEGLMVDHGIKMSHLKGVLATFWRELFGPKQKVRFRPSYFPFTEPSAEVDIGCIICAGKGCRVCKNSGWLEVMGCGMVHPKVFKAVGYDRHNVTGFAFGLGVERIAMLMYGINDIRLFYENDVRFLEQFK